MDKEKKSKMEYNCIVHDLLRKEQSQKKKEPTSFFLLDCASSEIYLIFLY